LLRVLEGEGGLWRLDEPDDREVEKEGPLLEDNRGELRLEERREKVEGEGRRTKAKPQQ